MMGGRKLSRKAKLAIKGVRVGATFAKIGASKKQRKIYTKKTKRLIAGIKKSDTKRRKK